MGGGSDMFGFKKKEQSGYWTQKTHLFSADEYLCSVCGRSTSKPYGVCPACKSRMKRSKYDPGWVDEAEALSAILDDDW